VAADLLHQHGRLDEAESQPPGRLGQVEAEPSLVDHRPPQRRVVGRTGAQVGPDVARGRVPVEQVAGRVAQRHLVVRQLEVHRVLLHTPPGPARGSF
jgi:hypothetical protein